MQLSNIAQFLEIYKKKLSSEDDKRAVLLKIISEETGIPLDEKVLSVERGHIKIKASPVLKNELFLHKIRILQKIHDAGRTDIHDIQ